MDVPTKDLNIIIYIKRNGKLIINKSLLNKYNRLVKMICRHIANINYDKSLVSDQLKILMFVTDHLNNRIKKNV